MKIVSAEQFRAWDEATINQGIRSIDLMERAASLCVRELMIQYPRETLFVVLCGMGNNGGDGLAITRLLHQNGYAVRAVVVQHSESYSADAAQNLERLQNINPALVALLHQGYFIQELPEEIILIDALLGTGLREGLKDWLAEIVQQINMLPNKKIAIDLPSGLMADAAPKKDAAIIAAHSTLTFQRYKRVMLHHEAQSFLGDIQVLDIGLDETFIKQVHTPYSMLSLHEVRQWVRPLDKFAHKGIQGSAHLAAGSEGMAGAAILAARSALRTGAGKVIVQTPECNLLPIQIALPEAVIKTSGKKVLCRIDNEHKDALGIGCGIGTAEETTAALRNYLEKATEPIVVDADALNVIAKEPALLHKVPAQSILTPHVKEYERVFGVFKDSMLRLENARTQAMKYNLHIVLKGHYTQIVTPKGHCWYNTSGNAGMATAGSGDVLTGMLTSLLAQGYEPLAAAMLGVFLHGVAGDVAANEYGKRSLLASDIIEHIGAAWKRIID